MSFEDYALMKIIQSESLQYLWVKLPFLQGYWQYTAAGDENESVLLKRFLLYVMQSLRLHFNCTSLVQKARPWSMPNQCFPDSLSAQKDVCYDHLNK